MTRATRLRGSGLWRRAAAFAAGDLRSRSAHFSWPGEPARAGARRSGARSVGVNDIGSHNHCVHCRESRLQFDIVLFAAPRRALPCCLTHRWLAHCSAVIRSTLRCAAVFVCQASVLCVAIGFVWSCIELGCLGLLRSALRARITLHCYAPSSQWLPNRTSSNSVASVALVFEVHCFDAMPCVRSCNPPQRVAWDLQRGAGRLRGI